jgi:tetratricopeptide (TPR) repeat protein
VGGVVWGFSGCQGWDPRSPFEHDSAEVDQALEDVDAGKLESAEKTLESFLNTGRCSADGGLLLSSDVRRLPNASFDLGLVLFRVGERYGRRFGEEDLDAGPNADRFARARSAEVTCALIVVQAIASDVTVPTETRARARYLAGNLEFLRRKYQDAVTEYDEALTLIPGLSADAGVDGIGRDAAWNRAIALRREARQRPRHARRGGQARLGDLRAGLGLIP